MCWLDGQPEGLHCFAREPGFTCAVNFGGVPGELPPHTKILLASEPVSDSKLPPFAAAWLAT
jgi:alpha-glucosidase